MKLWTGQSVSEFGTQISALAIPWLAAVGLHVSPFQFSLLGVLGFMPFILFALPAGVWVDRLRRRPILIVGDASRAVLLGYIPLAWALGILDIWQLYAITFAVGIFTVFFDVAYQSYLPALVDRDSLVEGNSKLQTTASLAGTAGPGMAGLMVFIGIVAATWFVIWVLCAYATTTAIVVLEDLPSSFDAFSRSWELTRGARLKVFGTVVVAWLISQFLPQLVVGGISGVLGVAGNDSLQPFFVVIASLMGIVLAPILPCALTLLYYDLRVRREAFDLQVLSEQLGTGMTETR